jgi:hypothetical protein
MRIAARPRAFSGKYPHVFGDLLLKIYFRQAKLFGGRYEGCTGGMMWGFLYHGVLHDSAEIGGHIRSLQPVAPRCVQASKSESGGRRKAQSLWLA